MSRRSRRPESQPYEELLAYQGRVVNVDHSHRGVAAACSPQAVHIGDVVAPQSWPVIRQNILDPVSLWKHESGSLPSRGPVCADNSDENSDNNALFGRIKEEESSTYTDNRGNKVTWELMPDGCMAYRKIELADGPLAGAVAVIEGSAHDQVIRSFEASDGSRFDMDARGLMQSASLTRAGLVDFERAMELDEVNRNAKQFFNSVAKRRGFMDRASMETIARGLLGRVRGAVKFDQQLYEIEDGQISVWFPINSEVARRQKYYIPKPKRNMVNQDVDTGVLAVLEDVRIYFDLRNPAATTAVARWRPTEGKDSILDEGWTVDRDGLLLTRYMHNDEPYHDDDWNMQRSDIRWRRVKGTERTGDPILGAPLRNEEDQTTFNFIAAPIFILLMIACFKPANQAADFVDRERSTMTTKEREDSEGMALLSWIIVGVLIPWAGAWFSAEMFLRNFT